MRYFKHLPIAEVRRARATNIDEHSSKMGTNTEKKEKYRGGTERREKGQKEEPFPFIPKFF